MKWDQVAQGLLDSLATFGLAIVVGLLLVLAVKLYQRHQDPNYRKWRREVKRHCKAGAWGAGHTTELDKR